MKRSKEPKGAPSTSSEETAPPEPIPPTVPELGESFPSPSRYAGVSSEAREVAAAHPGVRVPREIWDYVAGRAMQPRFARLYQKMGVDCEGGVPLTIQQRETLLSMFVSESIEIPGAKLWPCPF